MNCIEIIKYKHTIDGLYDVVSVIDTPFGGQARNWIFCGKLQDCVRVSNEVVAKMDIKHIRIPPTNDQLNGE